MNPSPYDNDFTEHKVEDQEAEKSEDVLNNLQHAAQFTITILPHPTPEKKGRSNHSGSVALTQSSESLPYVDFSMFINAGQ